MENTESKFYVGVGARKTPIKIQDIMTKIAIKMSKINMILRSGGAIGADKAFEKGAKYKQIFYASDATSYSIHLAKQFHPAWDNLGEYGKKLHGRNAFQVLGIGLRSPANVLICWTSDGCICHEDRTRATGGTGTAISIASEYGVPVFNLKRRDHLEEVLRWLK